MRGYTTECEHDEANQNEDKCFAAKPVSERINNCDLLIKKVQSILESLKIPVKTMKRNYTI